MKQKPSKGHSARCPVCSHRGGITVGHSVRGGEQRRTVACNHCSTVYLQDAPSATELVNRYRREFGPEATSLAMPIRSGRIEFSENGFAEVQEAWFGGQASNAIMLGATQTGDRVLELGCRDGRALELQKEMLAVDVTGVECEPGLVRATRARGIDCHLASLAQLAWGTERFDQIQMFHLLQRVPNPLQLLIRCRKGLSEGGRLIVELPNVHCPYGDLEKTFFQATNLVCYSESTLTGLLRRAGFEVERAVSASSLFMVARPAESAGEVDFSLPLLGNPEESAEWVSGRLHNYAAMERLRQTILAQGPSMDLLHALVQQLGRPAFTAHLVDVVVELTEFFMSHDAVGLACVVATAASEGPYDSRVTRRFDQLTSALRSDSAPTTELEHATKQAEQSREKRHFAAVLAGIRSDMATGLPLHMNALPPIGRGAQPAGAWLS